MQFLGPVIYPHLEETMVQVLLFDVFCHPPHSSVNQVTVLDVCSSRIPRVEDIFVEQLTVVKFLWKLNESPTGIFVRLRQVYGDYETSKTRVCEQANGFAKGAYIDPVTSQFLTDLNLVQNVLIGPGKTHRPAGRLACKADDECVIY